MLVRRQLNIQSLRSSRQSSSESRQEKASRKLSSAEIKIHEQGSNTFYSAELKFANGNIAKCKPMLVDPFVKRFKNYYEYYTADSKALFDTLAQNLPAARLVASAPVPVPVPTVVRRTTPVLSQSNVTIFGARSAAMVAAQERAARQHLDRTQEDGTARFSFGRSCG